MRLIDRRRIPRDPRKGLVLNDNEAVNYILTAVRE
tara:strand:+ start:146374 stop:146478 length:105 start_codon:yes stop_codon:yes gene_type:complete